VNEAEAKDLLAKAGAVITDSHVVYTSRKHGSVYVNKDAVYRRAWMTQKLCEGIAERFRCTGSIS
jgi:orotate phosphoribosyltransferase